MNAYASCYGIAAALVAALAAGIVPYQTDGVLLQAVMVTTALTTMLVLICLPELLSGKWSALKQIIYFGAAAAGLTYLVSQGLGYLGRTQPPLVLLSLSIVLFMYGLWALFLWAVLVIPGRIEYPGELMIGTTIIYGFFGALCFFAIDAGLKLVMG